MATRNLGTLEKVQVREIWPHEAHNFTRWLSDNLGGLKRAVSMELELLQQEHWMSGAGYVDVLAKEVKSGRKVVIENQLEPSDDDHFARLIGYAASRDAEILIWIAPEFYEWHRKMLSWLNEAGVEIFGIKVSVYRIRDVYAPYFEVVVGPDDSANHADAGTTRTPNIYGRFYRPLTAELRNEGLFAIGGRQGGWTGRYRRYRSRPDLEDAGISYYSVLGQGRARCSVGLRFNTTDSSAVYDDLFVRRNELEASMGDIQIDWTKGDNESYVWAEEAPLDNEEENTLEATRKWMKDTLVQLRDTFEPKLEEIRSGFAESVMED